MTEFQPTDRTTVRKAQRACYDRGTICSILDEGLVAHVGFVVDGQPFVTPMSYGRRADELILHGSPESRVVQYAQGGGCVCATVTLLDGLVLAKSATHHSMNYRSVVVLGVPQEIVEVARKREALRALVEHVITGRWREVRSPSEAELQATAVLAMPLDEVSAKIRTGPPVDARADLEVEHWAGEIPLAMTALPPIAAPSVPRAIPPPASVVQYRRPADR